MKKAKGKPNTVGVCNSRANQLTAKVATNQIASSTPVMRRLLRQ